MTKLIAPLEYIAEMAIERVQPNHWNPNKMTDKGFERLLKEIQETGFIEPIQVVPQDDGKYLILGGEHRYRAVKALGYQTIPCLVVNDERYQGEKGKDALKFITMRLNVLRGRVDPGKFLEYYQDLASRHSGEFLQDLMGVVEDDAWKRLLREAKISVQNAVEGIGDPKVKEAILAQFDKVSVDIKTVDDLSNVLNKLFTSHGSTLEHGYMIFGFGGQNHIYVKLKRKQFEFLHDKLYALQGAGHEVGDVLMDLLGGYVPSVEMIKAAEGEDSG